MDWWSGRNRQPLPFERAFVIQIRADADLAGGAVRGRAEHLSTGAAAAFDSLDELVAWMNSTVARATPRPSS
jgi:hypothetical protein